MKPLESFQASTYLILLLLLVNRKKSEPLEGVEPSTYALPRRRYLESGCSIATEYL